jgi:hypothetical protein
VRTFRGHKNEKNFVGLSVNNEYIACGSETNEAFVYHKVIAKVLACSCSHGTCVIWCGNCDEIFTSPSNIKQLLTIAGYLKTCSEP